MSKTAEEKAAEKAAKEQAKAEEKAKKEAEKAAEKAGEEASATGEPITVKYRDHRGEPTQRTFSKEVHGESFGALADEFKATNANRLISE